MIYAYKSILEGFVVGNSKFGKFVLIGALTGAAVSLLDKSTRRQVMNTSNQMVNQVKFYASNPDVLKEKFQQSKEKYLSLYDQFSGDAAYIKTQVDELKTLTPQVKELVVGTKEAFVDSKEEYKELMTETKETGDVKKS